MNSHVTRRNRREGYLADPMTMYSIDYIFEQAFTMQSFHKFVFGEYNLDLDAIYDKCEESRLPFKETIEKLSNKLYNNSSTYIKNKLIYKYFHNIGLDIMSLENVIYNDLKDLINIDDLINEGNPSIKQSEKIKIRYLEKLNEYQSLGADLDKPLVKRLRYIDDYLFGHLQVFNKLKNELTDTFNNVIKNEYRIKVDRGTKALQAFNEIQKVKQKVKEEQDTLNRSFGSGYFINSDFRTLSQSVGTTTILDPTSTYINDPGVTGISTTVINVLNTATSTYSQINAAIPGFSDVEMELIQQINLPKKWLGDKKPEPKITSKTPGVKILNKSLKSIRKFIPNNELNLLLKGGEFLIKCKRFNYGFRLRERKDLITYSKLMDHYSIKWDLNIYDKISDTKLTRACIVFRNCPILDNILSVYLMLKSGKEDEVLLNSGFFDKSELFEKKFTPILNIIKAKDKQSKQSKQSKQKKSNFEFGENHLNTDNINIYPVETLDDEIENVFPTVDGTLDGTDWSKINLKSSYFNRIAIEAELKMVIRNWLREYLLGYGMDSELYEYTTNLDVSFNEAVDYEAFQLFDIKIFDKYVKPLKWSVNDLPRKLNLLYNKFNKNNNHRLLLNNI